MICSIVPFSTSGLFYAGALRCPPVLSYLPWHFMAFICPILAIIYGYTGIASRRSLRRRLTARSVSLVLRWIDPSPFICYKHCLWR